MLIPGTSFNKGRNKLFFFFSQDILQRTDPGNLNQRRMPTALERDGDFSQTFDASGNLINIRDPRLAGNCSATAGGPACFPGNIIPANRIDSVGADDVEPVPAAECDRPERRQSVQLRVPDRAGLAAQRPGRCGWTGTSRRRPRPTDGCSGATKSARAACRSSGRAAAGRSSRASTRSTPSATSTRCCTPSTRRRSRSSRSA